MRELYDFICIVCQKKKLERFELSLVDRTRLLPIIYSRLLKVFHCELSVVLDTRSFYSVFYTVYKVDDWTQFCPESLTLDISNLEMIFKDSVKLI